MLAGKSTPLPPEIVLEVLKNVSSRDLMNVAQTSKSMAKLALDAVLWPKSIAEKELSQPGAIAALQRVRTRPRNFKTSLYRVESEAARSSHPTRRPRKAYRATNENVEVFGVASVYIGMALLLHKVGAPDSIVVFGPIAIIASAVFMQKKYSDRKELALNACAAKKKEGAVPLSLYAARACQATTAEMVQKTVGEALLHCVGFAFDFHEALEKELEAYSEAGVSMRAIDARNLKYQVLNNKPEWAEVSAFLEKYES